MPDSISLSHNQIVDLSLMRDAGQWSQAYNYLHDIVQVQRIQTTNDAGRQYDLYKLENWLDRAASINANDGSFSSEYVRGATAGIR